MQVLICYKVLGFRSIVVFHFLLLLKARFDVSHVTVVVITLIVYYPRISDFQITF
jgi:hypothetical protein